MRLCAIAVVTLLAACGSSDEPPDEPNEPCPLPESVDDLVRTTEQPVGSFPGVAQKATRLGDRALICGEGFVAMALADGTAPTVLEDGALAGPCAGVAAIGDNRALVATAGGQLVMVGAMPTGAPRIIASVSRANTTFHGVAIDGSDAWIAAGAAGVLRFAIAGDTLTEGIGVVSADARDATVLDGAMLVADGSLVATETVDGGAETRLFSMADGSQLAEVVGLPGIATRVIGDGTRAIVLRPGFGFDVYAVDPSGATPLALQYSQAVAIGLPFDAALDGDSLFVAAGSQLQRYELALDAATLVSTEDRAAAGDLLGSWFRSVVVLDGTLVAVTDRSIVPMTVGDGTPAPEIHIEQTTFTLAADQTEALFKFSNIGTAELVIAGVGADEPFSAEPYEEFSVPRPDCEGQYVVAPGESMLAWQRYAGDVTWQEELLRIESNDPDEPEMVAISEVHRPLPVVGDAVDDFSLPTIAGSHFRLTEHIGQVVVAKLYNPL